MAVLLMAVMRLSIVIGSLDHPDAPPFSCSHLMDKSTRVNKRTMVASTALALLLLSGCASLVERASDRVAGNLSAGVLNHDDPQTVAAGLPAYLLMLDGLIEGNPQSAATLRSAARLYSAYAGNFVDAPDRASRLSARAWSYAQRALQLQSPALFDALTQPYDAWQSQVAALELKDVALLFDVATTWAGYIQTHADDYAALAAIPRVTAALDRIAQLQPDYDHGSAYVYLGVLYSLRPAAVGGEPEKGRAAFEQAMQISRGRHLMAQTQFARQYARLVFDRALHDRLLQQDLSADPREPGLTLSNTLAQQQARVLLDAAADYF